MSEGTVPAVPGLPTVVASSGIDEETLGEGALIVELPSTSKFGIAWPSEPSPPIALPLSDRPVMLSSSEGETDVSEEELSRPARRSAWTVASDESEFVTPTNHMDSDQNPLDQAEHPPPLPRLSRAFSMPLPSQLGSLQNPRRVASSPSGDAPLAIAELPPECCHFQELSLELADSVQMVIQMLLQLSPPQVLDPAKEQLSACSLSIPTPSICAMFTSMKNLNYMSANMSALSLDPPAQSTATGVGERRSMSSTYSDFDVGEMLQSVGDALSGVAAQAGVDLVLFHGDVGLRHVGVKGDEGGISYTLSHVVRQIIGTAYPGDTIEIGLFLEPVSDSDTTVLPGGCSSPSCGENKTLRCVFHINHSRVASERASSTEESAGSSPVSPASPSFGPQPSFKTLFLRRLLSHVGASLETDVELKGLTPGRPVELSVELERDSPNVVNPVINTFPDDSPFIGNPELKISHEPTMEQLIHFAEGLRGKKATLYANPKGAFARHLTSYLTTWGMDISPVSIEPDADAVSESGVPVVDPASSPLSGRDDTPLPTVPEQAPGVASSANGSGADVAAFVLIDDDVSILRSRLQKIKAEQAYPLHLHTRKRPSLAANHRPRSSPQVARVMGLTASSTTSLASSPVIVHLTSLSNFKLVKDAIQSDLIPGFGNTSRLPEVIVIPKPAGPRRLLTALHTALTKPVVDPFFYPIATSPISPGFHAMSPFFNTSGAARSPGGRSSTSIRTASDKSARSPKDYPASSPRGASDSTEYFSNADTAAKLGAIPASGLVIQSPNGQPAGIFFHPKPKNAKGASQSPQSERAAAQYDSPGRSHGISFRRTPDNEAKGSLTVGTADIARRGPRSPAGASVEASAERDDPFGSQSKGKGRHAVYEGLAPLSPAESPITAGLVGSPIGESSTSSARTPTRKSIQSDNLARHASGPPVSPSRAVPAPPLRRPRRPNLENTASAPAAVQKKGKPTDTNIVPPISVLIVDDNPINQTILSTFMKKKKIKYDVAQNGEEAVDKWRSGGFHLILMDIQMPVMDGIAATKEIRRMEKLSATGGFPTTPGSEGQSTPSDTSTSESRSSTTSTPPYRSSVIIVALTASSLQSDRVAALAAGCNDFLTKPVSLHWLNSKIIEWGSIKALQMWADIRPEVVKSISSGQAVQAQHVARRLHVPLGRSTPTQSRSRSSSTSRKVVSREGVAAAARGLIGEDKTITPNTPIRDDSPGALPNDSSRITASVSESLAPGPAERVADIEIPAANGPSAQSEGVLVIPSMDLPGMMQSVEDTMPSAEHSGCAEPPNTRATPFSGPSERFANANDGEFEEKDASPAVDDSPPLRHDRNPPQPPPEPQ